MTLPAAQPCEGFFAKLALAAPTRVVTDPWALTWFERLPVLWRFRAAKTRLIELLRGLER
jgi:hypothetical protein